MFKLLRTRAFLVNYSITLKVCLYEIWDQSIRTHKEAKFKMRMKTVCPLSFVHIPWCKYFIIVYFRIFTKDLQEEGGFFGVECGSNLHRLTWAQEQCEGNEKRQLHLQYQRCFLLFGPKMVFQTLDLRIFIVKKYSLKMHFVFFGGRNAFTFVYFSYLAGNSLFENGFLIVGRARVQHEADKRVIQHVWVR